MAQKFINLKVSDELYCLITQAVSLAPENFGQWVRSRCELCAQREIREKDARKRWRDDALHMGDAEIGCPLYPGDTTATKAAT